MTLKFSRGISLVIAATLVLLFSPALLAASVAPVAAEHGMVVSAQHLATRVGVATLRRGGNAVDAAIAVAYALAVVYPAAGNLGGGGFMTLHLADGRQTFIDFRERAPLAATADMFLDEAGNVIPDLSTRSHKAVAVPGTVAGLELARKRYGSMRRALLIAPAIKLAQDGFVLDEGDVLTLQEASADLARDPASAAIFLAHGKPLQVGQRLIQKDLAKTLRAISRRGASGFYQGPVAAALLAASQAGGGILSQADLRAYTALEREPVRCMYRGYQIVAAPPPSSGGVTVCQILRILEGYPLAELGYHSAQAVHYQIEAMRYAYADRNHHLGDPQFVKNPVAELLDPAYAAHLRSLIKAQRAGVSATIKPGVILREGSNTTHFSIADQAGNAVSLTYTLNDWFGARLTADGTGVLLNNEMDDFTAKPGVANLYGLVQGSANAIAPGKRPLSSMSPTIVTKDGAPVMVLGTPGGSRIISAVLLTLLNVIDYGMNIQEAVDAPRFHHQWLPDLTNVETHALSPDTRALLEAWGHTLAPPQPANHLAAILIGAPTLGGAVIPGKRFFGANDPRRNSGLALGY